MTKKWPARLHVLAAATLPMLACQRAKAMFGWTLESGCLHAPGLRPHACMLLLLELADRPVRPLE